MQNICNWPNFLSFLRIPLAACLFYADPYVRCMVLVLAMLSDVLDGHIARKAKNVSRFGTFLDPITDKFFVVVALFVFYQEKKFELFELYAFLSRDFSLLLFSCVLIAVQGFSRFTVRAFFCGKVVTALQFITLIMLCLNYAVPQTQYWVMTTFGVSSFFELLWIYKKSAALRNGA